MAVNKRKCILFLISDLMDEGFDRTLKLVITQA